MILSVEHSSINQLLYFSLVRFNALSFVGALLDDVTLVELERIGHVIG